MSTAINLGKMNNIINEGKTAGDGFTTALTAIHGKITNSEAEGSIMGTMIASTLELSEAQITLDTRSGVAKNAANQVKAGAADVKKAAG